MPPKQSDFARCQTQGAALTNVGSVLFHRGGDDVSRSCFKKSSFSSPILAVLGCIHFSLAWILFKPSAPLQELFSWRCSGVLLASMVVSVEYEDTDCHPQTVGNQACSTSPSLPIILHN